jgi:hypothetical protein
MMGRRLGCIVASHMHFSDALLLQGIKEWAGVGALVIFMHTVYYSMNGYLSFIRKMAEKRAKKEAKKEVDKAHKEANRARRPC